MTTQHGIDEKHYTIPIATADVAVRNSQFQSLMQSLLDLKQSLTEPLEQTTTTRPGDADDDKPLPMDIELAEKGEEDGSAWMRMTLAFACSGIRTSDYLEHIQRY
jgi:hypothetical protein